MPDHLHILGRGTDPSSSVKKAIDHFKWASGVWFKRNAPQFKWQGDYYDHIVRDGDDWRRQAFYIFCNPVLAGLVVDPYEYPSSGSVGYVLRDTIDGAW